MPRNQERNHIRVAAILNSLPGTQGQLHEKTGIPQSALARWLPRLVNEGKIHYLSFFPSTHGGPLRPIYLAGPKPPGKRIRYPESKTAAERAKSFRDRSRKSGHWEEVLAKRRARRALQRQPAIDPLMQAFFGVKR